MDARTDELAELRRLLLGAQQARLDALDARVYAQALTPEQIATQLPEAIVLRAARDKQLARALAPTVESAISESVRRKPGEFAEAIFPVLGPAIRKAIAETMSELVGSINRAMQHSFSMRGLSWRVEAWRTGVPYAQVVIKHALVYRVEQLFLVHTETGLLLAQAHPPNLAVPDADLVSGMLTAIRDFVGDSFVQEKDVGGLRTFTVGELTVMVEPGPRALLAAVVRGQAPESYLRRLQETIEGVHARFARALQEFEGETTPFEATVPLLEDCLVTVLETDQPVGAKVSWKPWAIGAGIAAIALVAWAMWSGARWQQALAALNGAPGLSVMQAERSWGAWHIRGLRDPDAQRPNALLASSGGDTTRTVQQWDPYLSLDPAITMARSKRVLAPPPGAELRLHGDTLSVGGTVDAAWLAQTARRTYWPAGVSTLDARSATLAVPASLAPVADSLVRGHVLFAPGSTELDGAAQDAVRSAARHVRRMSDAMASLGVTASVALTGRADATGTESTNETLSKERAEAVRRALAAALGSAKGAPAVAFDPKGVGTGEPLSASDSVARARVNRSVSFGVRLTLDAPSGARPQ